MPRVVLARDLKHEQIEFPQGMVAPEGRRGGDTSSLHLRRGAVRDVTAEELVYIRDHRPGVFRALDVLPEPRVPARVARKLAQAQALTTAPAPAAPVEPPARPSVKEAASGKAGARKTSKGPKASSSDAG